MDKKLFGDLVESIQQHNEIIPGTRKAARATRVDAQSIGFPALTPASRTSCRWPSRRARIP
jgi:hypothetical protein